MRQFFFAAAAAVLLASPSLAAADTKTREVVVVPQLSDVEKQCIDQLRYNWSQPDAYDDTFKRITLEEVVHRKDGQNDVIVFNGKAYNSFLQLDRATIVTCRPADKPPFLVTFQIER